MVYRGVTSKLFSNLKKERAGIHATTSPATTSGEGDKVYVGRCNYWNVHGLSLPTDAQQPEQRLQTVVLHILLYAA